MTRIELFKRTIVATLGLMFFPCGLYIIIQANIGVAPWDVLCFGVAGTIGVKCGIASIGISLAALLIDVIMKEKIGLGTLSILLSCLLSWPKEYIPCLLPEHRYKAPV